MQREACRGCTLRDICTIRPPLTSRGSKPRVFTECVYFTCTTGKQSAEQAFETKTQPTSFEDEAGAMHTGNIFGTKEKPTHLPTSHLRRVVEIPTGVIYTIDRHNRGRKTAVTIPINREDD